MSTANHIIQDPVLTDLGHEQCQTLRANFPRHPNIDLVTASPLRRTIYTALESFAPVFESNPDLKIIALPDIQETSDVPCDTGSDPSVLKEEFKTGVDLDLVQDGWNNKVGFSPFCKPGVSSTVSAHGVLTFVSKSYPVATSRPTKPSKNALVQPVAG
ncbi:MAG: histidine phosphatase family protein [Acinetobacter pittii]|nr:histidine phosphatase family protein [Acinetobacter pittii]